MKSEKVKIDKPLSKLMEIRHSGTYSLFTFTYSLNRQVSKGKSGEWGNSEERRVKSEKVKIDKSLSKLVDFGGAEQSLNEHSAALFSTALTADSIGI